MKKKLITIISSAAILACAMPVQTAFAADATACNFTLTADKETVHPDEEVKLTLSVNPNGDTLGFEFDFGTLPTGFTYVEDTLTILDSAKSTLGWSDFQIYEDDRIGFFVTDDSKVYGGGKINVATLKIKAGADAGAGSVVITPGEMIALDSKGDEATTTLTQPDLKIPGLELVPAVSATCKIEGNKAYYKCDDGCGLIYETNDRTSPTTLDDVKIAKTAHDFTATKTDPEYLSTAATCSAPAKYFKSCAVCGEKGTETFESGAADKSKHGETELKNKKEATCSDKGYTGDEVCKLCGDIVKKGEDTPATGKHTGGKATCSKKAVCDNCGKEYGDLNPDNHEDVTLTGKEDPTCTKPGNTGSGTCSACGKTFEGKELAALGHKGGTATCNKKAVCDTCKEEYGELDKNNHGDNGTEIKNAKEATETADGYTGDTVCKGCDTVLKKGTVIPKKGSSGSSSDNNSSNSKPTAVGTVTFPSSSNSSDNSSNAGNSGSTDTSSSAPNKPSNNTSSDTGANTNANKPSSNPATGITVTVIPMVIAAGAAVIIAKNKKK